VIVFEGLDIILRLLQPVAGDVELDDDAVVNEAVDGCGCGHGIFEDSFPFGKGKIAGQQNAATLVAFGQKREHDFHFLACLSDVTQVVDDHSLIAGILLDQLAEVEIAFGD
jgi:hypothetical protein